MFSICSKAIFLISTCVQAYKKAYLKSTDPSVCGQTAVTA